MLACIIYLIYDIVYLRLIQHKLGYCKHKRVRSKDDLKKKELIDYEAEVGQSGELDFSCSSD